MTTFKDLGLNPAIQQALDELGYQDPTPIQEEAIPQLLGGHDVIGQAQTGTGKTAAFGLPLLQYLDPENNEVQAIVMTPTRELCIQVTQALRSMAEHLDIEIVAVFGGAPIRSQQSQLRSGAHVVVATVGRMMDLMNRRSLVLTAARYVVLDEADEMLDLGFIEDVEKILRMCPSGRQTALFSATMPPPIQKLAEGYMYDPVTISITPKTLTVDAIQQAFVEVPAKEKTARLIELLKIEEPEQAIIFCRTKIGATRLERALKDKGLDVKALHGDMSQGSRDGVMIAFKDHRVKLLVATDIAARGLDVEHVTHVINFDVPNSSESYVHRIGRTGRVGRTGRAITFVTPAERDEIGRIERDVNTKIGEWESPEERLEHAPAPRRRERRPRREREETPEPEAVKDDAVKDDAETEDVPEREAEAVAATNGTAEPSADADNDSDGDGEKPATTKLFVNRGERSGIDEEDLRWALREGAVLPDEAVHDVRVLHRFSFVEVDPDQAERTVEFLDGTKLKGKEIRLEVAKS
ncbi:MAG: box helicase [Solirubrobacterales bacterium]|nr:box helicase [Solirubrobacterales bacterium]